MSKNYDELITKSKLVTSKLLAAKSSFEERAELVDASTKTFFYNQERTHLENANAIALDIIDGIKKLEKDMPKKTK